MASVRTVLLGSGRVGRSLHLLFTLTLLVATTLSYALDLFSVAGGVVFVPGDAAIVGLLGAAVVGYRHGGLVFGWLAAYGALLGYLVDHAILGQSSDPIGTRLAHFLALDGLAFLGIEALVVGSIGFLAGKLGALGVGHLRSRTGSAQSGPEDS